MRIQNKCNLLHDLISLLFSLILLKYCSMEIKVKNLKETSDLTCNCDGWLNHWSNNLDKIELPLYCSAKNCFNKAEAGAHVKMIDSSDSATYVVPFCKSCNVIKDVYIVHDFTLVPAASGETCG